MHVERLYRVYDTRARIYTGPVMACLKDAQAARMFYAIIEAGKNDLSDSPLDYELHYLGGMDLETGLLLDPDNDVGPETITNGTTWRQTRDANDRQIAGGITPQTGTPNESAG